MLEILNEPIDESSSSLSYENHTGKNNEGNIKRKKEINSQKNSKDANTNDTSTNSESLLSLNTNKRKKKNYSLKDYQLFGKINEKEIEKNFNNIGNELNQLKGINSHNKTRNNSNEGTENNTHENTILDKELDEENSEGKSDEGNLYESIVKDNNSQKGILHNEKYGKNEYYNLKRKSNKSNNIKSNFNKNFLYSELKNIDYSQHGNNWDMGKCKSGKFQSPVDLHLQGLKERDLKNIADVYLNLFYDDDYAWNNYNKPWMKGDIFYYYEYLIKKLVINRKDNVFQIKPANNGVIPFGVLFTTDNPTMFYADQIHFHSPSEHTFQGSGNRREIEMQIFHYTNDLYQYDEEELKNTQVKINLNNKFKNNTGKKENYYHSYLVSFLMNSLSNPQLEKKYTKRIKKGNMKNQYQVLSITFTSAEIDKSTIDHFKKLPSEKFLRTILNASHKVPVGSEPKLVELDDVLNLDALMMMLNIENMEFLSYHGSSTLPLCEENVYWKVAKQPLPVSTELILDFYKMLKKHTPNYKGSDNDNYRVLQNVDDNKKNYEKVYLIQGFPIQVLISSALSTLEDREVINIIKDASTKSFSSYQYFNYFLFYFFFYIIKLFI